MLTNYSVTKVLRQREGEIVTVAHDVETFLRLQLYDLARAHSAAGTDESDALRMRLSLLRENFGRIAWQALGVPPNGLRKEERDFFEIERLIRDQIYDDSEPTKGFLSKVVTCALAELGMCSLPIEGIPHIRRLSGPFPDRRTIRGHLYEACIKQKWQMPVAPPTNDWRRGRAEIEKYVQRVCDKIAEVLSYLEGVESDFNITMRSLDRLIYGASVEVGAGSLLLQLAEYVNILINPQSENLTGGQVFTALDRELADPKVANMISLLNDAPFLSTLSPGEAISHYKQQILYGHQSGFPNLCVVRRNIERPGPLDKASPLLVLEDEGTTLHLVKTDTPTERLEALIEAVDPLVSDDMILSLMDAYSDLPPAPRIVTDLDLTEVRIVAACLANSLQVRGTTWLDAELDRLGASTDPQYRSVNPIREDSSGSGDASDQIKVKGGKAKPKKTKIASTDSEARDPDPVIYVFSTALDPLFLGPLADGVERKSVMMTRNPYVVLLAAEWPQTVAPYPIENGLGELICSLPAGRRVWLSQYKRPATLKRGHTTELVVWDYQPLEASGNGWIPSDSKETIQSVVSLGLASGVRLNTHTQFHIPPSMLKRVQSRFSIVDQLTQLFYTLDGPRSQVVTKLGLGEKEEVEIGPTMRLCIRDAWKIALIELVKTRAIHTLFAEVAALGNKNISAPYTLKACEYYALGLLRTTDAIWALCGYRKDVGNMAELLALDEDVMFSISRCILRST